VRVAALYDIHGKHPAVEAVLDEVRQAEADSVVSTATRFRGGETVGLNQPPSGADRL
jgi:hypothetical protein